MHRDFDVAVVGAGVVGLACAADLAKRGHSVVVLEGSDRFGTGNSSRNSEVLHSGLYYDHGSLKHTLCLRGGRLLRDFLDASRVDYRICGKLIVASDEAEMTAIASLMERGECNGVEGLELLSRAQISMMEPELVVSGGLLCRTTGIIDSHGYMLALISVLEENGGVAVFNSPAISALYDGRGFDIAVGGVEPSSIKVGSLVNSAGLFAQRFARRIEGLNASHLPPEHLAKGSYFALQAHFPFSRLVYPCPVDGGLGVHATLDLSGNVRFGPDVEWLPGGTEPDKVDYSVDVSRADVFAASIRRYWPNLRAETLAPAYSGCRPKLAGPGRTCDFMIQTHDHHGVMGLVNLFGIESPGLTSSMAIAECVAAAIG